MLKRLLLIVLLIPLFSWAQSTGKIAGYVTDANTGEGLAGANVILEGTLMGAQTDVEGFYFVLNVPAGTHTVSINYVGYRETQISGVRVSAGVTTNQNVQIEEATLELGEAVIVTAERPLVEKNITQSYSLVTTESLEAIPVRGLNNILSLQASVVVQDGAVHIRGGRSEEVGYYLDGASTSNILTNANQVYVIQDAVEEIQVLTGGYTAEHGGANSGIVMTQIKSGQSEFKASLDFQTDKFVSEGEEFLGTTSFQDYYATASISGPIVGDNIRFFVAAENVFQGDDEKRFGKGFTFRDLIDENQSRVTDDTVAVMSYPKGFTPNNERDLLALNASVIFDYDPISLRVGANISSRERELDGSPWRNILRDRLVIENTNTMLLTAKLTHVLSPSTFYDLTLGFYQSEVEDEDSRMGTNWKTWYDSSAVNIPGAYRDRWRAAPNYIFNGIGFWRPGAPNNDYDHSKQEYLSGALNLIHQLGRHHELKIGGDAKLYTVRSFEISPSVVALAGDAAYSAATGITTYGSIEDVPVDVWQGSGSVDSYGYDLYGNETSSIKRYGSTGIYTEAPKEPIFASAYIQDKMEYDDLIINAGLRLDYFDADDRSLKNPGGPLSTPGGMILESEWEAVDPYVLVSPRLGFSFPVSERTVFYFQYGKFAQLPQLNQLYNSGRDYATQIVAQPFYFQTPVGFGLEPIKTTNYEIGFRNQISDQAAFDITGFYRNVKGQVQTIQQASGGDIQAYARYANGDFATTKGLEFKLTMRRTQRIQAQLAYTLTNAQGSGSNSTSYRAAIAQGTPSPSVVSPLDYEQTHRGSINLDYRFNANDGGMVLENSGANMLFTFNSGHPFTRVAVPPGGQVSAYTAGVDYMNDSRAAEAQEPIGASSTPWNFNIDLRLDKSFNIADMVNATVYMRVNNLLNTKNVINVYTKTGNANDDGYLSNPEISGDNIDRLGQQYVDMYQAIVLDNGGAYRDQLGLELWGQPRQIFFGIKLTY